MTLIHRTYEIDIMGGTLMAACANSQEHKDDITVQLNEVIGE